MLAREDGPELGERGTTTQGHLGLAGTGPVSRGTEK